MPIQTEACAPPHVPDFRYLTRSASAILAGPGSRVLRWIGWARNLSTGGCQGRLLHRFSLGYPTCGRMHGIAAAHGAWAVGSVQNRGRMWRFQAAGATYVAMAMKWDTAPRITKICQISWKPNFPGRKLNTLVAYTIAPSV